MNKTALIIFLFPLLFAVSDAGAQVILRPEADTYINSEEPGTAFGTNENLRVRSSSTIIRQPYMRFAIG